jgi:hypothetical protein
VIHNNIAITDISWARDTVKSGEKKLNIPCERSDFRDVRWCLFRWIVQSAYAYKTVLATGNFQQAAHCRTVEDS